MEMCYFQIKLPKTLDRIRGCCYNVQRCHDSDNKSILENDTAKSRSRRKNSQISERVNAWNIREALRALASPRRGGMGQVRIEHQSLILAQDERWRRA